MVACKNNNTREMETNSFHLNFPLKSLHTIRPNILKIDILNFLFCITPSAVVPPPYLLGQPCYGAACKMTKLEANAH